MLLSSYTFYCADLVRQASYEEYVISLIMPRSVRPALLAILALNVELRRIRFSVNEPLLGRIRLQWWHEAVERLYQGRPEVNPIIKALKEALDDGTAWQQADIQRLISGYENEFPRDDFAKADEVSQHLTERALALMDLLCSAVNDKGNGADRNSIALAYEMQHYLRYALQKKLPPSLVQDMAAGQLTALRSLRRKSQLRLLRLYLWLARRHWNAIMLASGDVSSPAVHRADPLISLKMYFSS